MRFLGAFLVFLPVLIYLLRNRRKAFFSPGVAFSWLYVIKVVMAVLVYSNISLIDEDDDFLKKALCSDNSFFEYCLLQSLSYMIVIWAIHKTTKSLGIKKRLHVPLHNKKLGRRYFFLGCCFYVMGVIGFLLIMSKVGGILFFFSNLQYRRSLVEDLDFENMLLSVLNYAPLLIIYSKSLMRKNIGVLDVIMIVVAGLMTGLGGRKALLMIVIGSAFIYNFTVKEINIKKFLTPKYIVGFFCLFIFFSFYSKLRKEGAAEELLLNPTEFFVENQSEGIVSALTGESYVPFFVGVVNHFENHDYWYGRSFSGLLTAFIPSSFYPAKPAVDDGMYLYSIAQGRGDINPPMPAKSLDYTSWPLETFGSMYANFGPLGVLLGMLIVGLVIGWFYNKMVTSNYDFFYIAMYIQVLFTFEMSTLRIVQVLISFVILKILSVILNKV